MEKDSGKKLNSLAVDGGMCESELVMQVSPNYDIFEPPFPILLTQYCLDTSRSNRHPRRSTEDARDDRTRRRNRSRVCHGRVEVDRRTEEHQHDRRDHVRAEGGPEEERGVVRAVGEGSQDV